MDKRLAVISVAALAILSLVAFGCKGKVENPPEERKIETSETIMSTGEGMSGPITEPSESVGTEMIPPTANPPATAGTQPGVLQQGADRNMQIQMALKAAGFYQGAVDGKIGPKTKRAIQDFQKANGLKVDGKVGPRTWVELEKFLTKQ